MASCRSTTTLAAPSSPGLPAARRIPSSPISSSRGAPAAPSDGGKAATACGTTSRACLNRSSDNDEEAPKHGHLEVRRERGSVDMAQALAQGAYEAMEHRSRGPAGQLRSTGHEIFGDRRRREIL